MAGAGGRDERQKGEGGPYYHSNLESATGLSWATGLRAKGRRAQRVKSM